VYGNNNTVGRPTTTARQSGMGARRSAEPDLGSAGSSEEKTTVKIIYIICISDAHRDDAHAFTLFFSFLDLTSAHLIVTPPGQGCRFFISHIFVYILCFVIFFFFM
jgi:hypothetical protein